MLAFWINWFYQYRQVKSFLHHAIIRQPQELSMQVTWAGHVAGHTVAYMPLHIIHCFWSSKIVPSDFAYTQRHTRRDMRKSFINAAAYGAYGTGGDDRFLAGNRCRYTYASKESRHGHVTIAWEKCKSSWAQQAENVSATWLFCSRKRHQNTHWASPEL